MLNEYCVIEVIAEIKQGGRGGPSNRGRGGGPGSGPSGPGGGAQERKKKESILNLANYVDKSVRVKFMGGREGE